MDSNITNLRQSVYDLKFSKELDVNKIKKFNKIILEYNNVSNNFVIQSLIERGQKICQKLEN
jgi:hypothetical protein